MIVRNCPHCGDNISKEDIVKAVLELESLIDDLRGLHVKIGLIKLVSSRVYDIFDSVMGDVDRLL